MGSKNVTIDGVLYAPVIESDPNMEAIARGLLASFWGEVVNLNHAMEGVYVNVNDNGDGIPIEEALLNISNALREIEQGG